LDGRRTSEVFIRALVFDFDGLILDTETAEHQAWQEIFRQHGTELPLDRWVDCIGTDASRFDPYEQLERQLGELVDREAIQRARIIRTAELVAARSTLPGVRDFIESATARGLRLGVASSSSEAWVSEHLNRLGLYDAFDAIRCADHVEQVKPDPAVYLCICEALEVPPSTAIAIEDSPNGILAAKRAGLYCLSVPNLMTRSLSMDAADMVVVSLATISLDEVIERASRPRLQAS
jgi:HAD superfamily hydrolase (TIGR01509 family)